MLKNVLKKTYCYKLWRKYQDEKLRKSNEERNAYFKAEAVSLLKHYAETLNREGITFWLDFGTLLGCYREHDFIAHDCDLDTGAYIDDAKRINSALTKAGFSLIREFNCPFDGSREECYKYGNTSIDVFYFQKEGSNRYCYLYHLLDKKKFNVKLRAWVQKITVPDTQFTKTQFKGIDVLIPEDTASYLTLHYGPNFMIPNTSFNRDKEATNLTTYSYEERPAEMLLKS